MAVMAPMLIMMAISVALAVVAALLMPKPKNEFDSPDFNFPTSKEGSPIAIPIGTTDCTGQYIWPKDAVSAKKEVVAHKVESGGKGFLTGGGDSETYTYRLSWAICLGWGPIDRIIEVRVGNCWIWRGPIDYDAADFPDGYMDLSVGNGLVRFYFGTATQNPDPYLVAELGDVPPWRGLSYIIFYSYDVGTSPTVPQVTVRVRRSPQSPLTDAHKTILTDVGDGSNCEIYEANPVHVMAEMLTNSRYGAAVPVATLDMTSWNAAAAIIATEGLGISDYMDSQETLQSFIENVLAHIDAGIVQRNGILYLKLTRYDYDPNTVPVIPQKSISDFTLESTLPGALPTQVVISFRDWRKNYADANFPVHNIGATIDADTARRDRIDLPLFTVRAIAAIAGHSKFMQLTTPHDAVSFVLDRANGIALEWGDVVAIDYSLCGVTTSRIWRIISLERQATSSRYVQVKAMEELCSNRSSVDPAIMAVPDDPVGILGPLTYTKPFELPWDATGGSLAVCELVARDQTFYPKFLLQSGLTVDLGTVIERQGTFIPAGSLNALYKAGTLSVDDAGFLITPSVDVAEFSATASVDRVSLFTPRNLMVIDDEILAFQVIELEGTSYRIRGVLRGLYDTDAAAHLAGAKVFILPDGKPPVFCARQPGWANGTTIYLRAVPYTRAQTGALHQFALESLTLTERAKRPFPVANILADGKGSIFSPTYTSGNQVRISWVARTRGAGMGYPNQDGMWEDGVPVEGSFEVEIWVSTTLKRTVEIPATQTVSSGFLTGRHYYDYDPSLDSSPATFIARVYSIVNGWRSANYRSITVTKA